MRQSFAGTNSLHILFEDPDIIVCEKPHGVATQSRRIGSPDMVNLIKRHLYENAFEKMGKSTESALRKEPYLAVIHRLDQPVRGILVFAKTKSAAKDLNHQLQQGDFGKYYLALTDGKPATSSGTLENYLYKNAKTSTAEICNADRKGAKKARLSYEVCNELKEFFADVTDTNTPSRNLLKIRLDTGRFHQIRCQLAQAGYPIAGDTKYNPGCRSHQGWQTLCLCAFKLSFTHPVTHRSMEFSLI